MACRLIRARPRGGREERIELNGTLGTVAMYFLKKTYL
jgi:hypothetical protein